MMWPCWNDNLFAGLQDIDYALWTGDIPAHNIWNQSRSDQVQFAVCRKYWHVNYLHYVG